VSDQSPGGPWNQPPAETPQIKPSTVRFMLRALSYRNCRLFFGGQIVSLIGTWLSMVATSWLVYRLAAERMPGHAAILLGIVGFAGQIPIFLIAPVAGVLVDRWPRRRILIGTQAVSMAQSFAMATLVLRETITIPQIIALSVVQGVVNALDMPARQSFVVGLVKQSDVGNAIALSSSMVHAARLLGPAIAGVLIYQVGEGICFLIDGFSYLAVLLALVAIRVDETERRANGQRAWHALQEGMRYAFGFRPIRVLLMMVAVTSVASMSQSVLMPIFADQILGGGERTLGLLLGASGLGALCGSLYLASRRTVVGLGRVIGAASCLLGVGLISFSLSQLLASSIAALVAAGFALVVQLASCNTLLQTIVDDDKRGRVMSLFTMSFMGMAPFGSLLSGWIANNLGPAWALTIAGCVCLSTGALFALRLKSIRPLVVPIYVKKGILPPIADGIAATAELAASSPE
jgi:MFS family permease